MANTERMAEVERELALLRTSRIGSVTPGTDVHTLTGRVVSARTMKSQRRVMTVAVVEDGTGEIGIEYAQGNEEHGEEQGRRMKAGAAVVATGRVRMNAGEWTMAATALDTLEQARIRWADAITVEVQGTGYDGVGRRLQEVLETGRRGDTPVHVDYRCPAGRAIIELGAPWRMRPGSALLEGLWDMPGATRVTVSYAPEGARR